MENKPNDVSICRTCLSTDSTNLEDMFYSKIADMLNCYFLQVLFFVEYLFVFFNSIYRFLKQMVIPEQFANNAKKLLYKPTILSCFVKIQEKYLRNDLLI